MASAPKPDARLRPFRAAAWAFYLVVAGVFSLLIIVGVIRSTLAMSPPHQTEAAYLLGTTECAGRLRALFNELEEQRRQLVGTTGSARKVDREWVKFRLEWLGRERSAESVCALNAQGREKLARAFRELNSLMNLYTTHAVQFAGEVGPTVDAFEEALEAAKH